MTYAFNIPIMEYLFPLSFYFFVCAFALCADVCVEARKGPLVSFLRCHLPSFWGRQGFLLAWSSSSGLIFLASRNLSVCLHSSGMHVCGTSLNFFLSSGDVPWVLMLARALLTEWFPSPSLQNHLHIWVSRIHLCRISLTTVSFQAHITSKSCWYILPF